MSITCYKNGNTYTARLAVYKGRVVDSIYYGSKKVLESEGFVYVDNKAGTKTIYVPIAGVYDIDIVGAGGGGTRTFYQPSSNLSYYSAASGGSGGHAHWWQYLSVGNYSVTIGAGGTKGNPGRTGGDTVFLSQTAKGGTGGSTSGTFGGCTGGSGGSCVTSFYSETGNTGDTNSNGESETTESVFGGFGKGGAGKGTGENGTDGSIRLVFHDTEAPIIFESSIAGTYSVNIIDAGDYEITMVGGGGGGGYFTNYSEYGYVAQGGQASMISGIVTLAAGEYEIIVGEAGAAGATGYGGSGGNGGDTTFNGNTAGGGFGAMVAGYIGEKHNGYGGTATVVSAGLTGSDGEQGNTNPKYNEYGAGGTAGGYWSNAGGPGYIKIVRHSG